MIYLNKNKSVINSALTIKFIYSTLLFTTLKDIDLFY